MRAARTVARPGLPGSAYDYAIAALIAIVLVVMAGTWATGQLAGLLFRQAWPPVGPGQAWPAALALPHHWADPRLAWPAAARQSLPGAPGFAVAGVLVTLALTVAIVLGARRLAAHRPRNGLASPVRLKETLSHRAVVVRGPVIRPSLASRKITLTDVGVHLGRAVHGGMPLAISAEDSVGVLAAPRQGKTSQVIIPWLHTWPGPALVTTIRPDVLLATATLRRPRGPVAVMAPPA